ncbi:MAG: efflux RND transporter periplasmic adaptor subunit [Proteobacteria bacterium]|nr:efflux RND transporter periplasmic adaptor subunit [Pseudomonadota bacterium]MBU4296611.1 efflux RND transporter periplasmic adaptor subunit [Pseudomonadota bacterium]MCG2748240.1 efflux RND transporter periplasmic adaptor subunit [Desulfobulbaceae bacterium]
MKGKIVKVLVVAVLSLLSAGCQDKIGPGTAEVKRPVVSGVQTGEVVAAAVDEYYESSATFKAKTESVVAARMMGTVTMLQVKEGDAVKAGQLLLTLDDRDVRQKINGAQAALAEAESGVAAAAKQKELAQTTYGRFKNLFDGKALTRQELDEAETRMKVAELEYERFGEMVKRARAGLAEAKVYQDFTRVTSPVDGVVKTKQIELGTMAMPGVPLFIIEDNSSFRLEIGVNETLVDRLAPGLPVVVTIPATGKELSGKISDVVPAVDPRTRNFLVKIDVAGPGLQSGMYANVRIPVGKRSTILLPMEIIVEKGQLNGVYTVDGNNVITYRLVRLGKVYGDKKEILAGLQPGEKVITGGVDRAVDGGLLQGDKGQ